MTIEELGVQIRPADEGDLEFVVNSWLESYRWNDHVKEVRDADYYRGQKALIVRLLQDNLVLVACLETAPRVAIGWSCTGGTVTYSIKPRAGVALVDSTPPIIHFIYVKKDFRGYGIAKRMLGNLDVPEIHATHITKTFRRWMRTHSCYRYNPYLLMET